MTQEEREFTKNYTGILDPHRAYLANSTGDRKYKLRNDLYPDPPEQKPERSHETYPPNKAGRWG